MMRPCRAALHLQREGGILIQEIAAERALRVFPERQWSDFDFEPVAQAMDDLFGELGWIQRQKW